MCRLGYSNLNNLALKTQLLKHFDPTDFGQLDTFSVYFYCLLVCGVRAFVSTFLILRELADFVFPTAYAVC